MTKISNFNDFHSSERLTENHSQGEKVTNKHKNYGKTKHDVPFDDFIKHSFKNDDVVEDFEEDGMVFSDIMGDYIDENDAVYSEYLGDFATEQYARKHWYFSKKANDFLPK
jgi:hypothetical protein